MQVTETTTIAYLGPPGTFTEEALLSQPDLAQAHRVPFPNFWDVLAAVGTGADGRRSRGAGKLDRRVG